MSDLTLLQKVMRIVEKHEPNLFDANTQKGRDFMHEMTTFLQLIEYSNNLKNKSL